jgi:hypothetical protein
VKLLGEYSTLHRQRGRRSRPTTISCGSKCSSTCSASRRSGEKRAAPARVERWRRSGSSRTSRRAFPRSSSS